MKQSVHKNFFIKGFKLKKNLNTKKIYTLCFINYLNLNMKRFPTTVANFGSIVCWFEGGSLPDLWE